jgi:hypothetical protein
MAKYGPVGGDGGDAFDDQTQLGPDPATVRIIGLIVRSGKFVDSITPIYQDGTGKVRVVQHGGDGGDRHPPVDLAPGEFITEISGRSGQFVDSLTLETSLGQRLSFGGSGGGPVEGYEFPPETDGPQEVVAFHGGATQFLDRIGIYTRPHPAPRASAAAASQVTPSESQ